MEFDGLALRYPVNRQLTREEELRCVKPTVRTSQPANDFQLTIRRTGIFVEVPDKYFAWRGFISGLFLGPFIAFFYISFWLLPAGIAEGYAKTPVDDRWQAWAAGIFGLLCMAVILGMLGWGLLRESFTLTHYPIRFNRKNRMVYVVRPKRRADILSVKWDDVYWHIRHNKNKQFGGYNWFVAGHVMDKDRKTVRETFAFGHVASAPEDVYPQWEYVRRFMEDGPDAIPQAQSHLPIDGRKEGFWWGAQMLLFQAPPAGLLGTIGLLPFLTLAAFTRWLCMLTNRVPKWPADIEAQCASSPEDERHPLKPATPQYAKIMLTLTIGLTIDAAALAWVYSVSPWAN